MFSKNSIRMKVPPKLKEFLTNPTPKFTKAVKEADKESLKLLQANIKSDAPKKSGKLAGSIKINLPGRKVYSSSVYSRAVELGHYAVPKNTPKKMFLKFTGTSGDVFLRYLRTKKQPFFLKHASKDRVKVINIYDKAFKKLLESL